MPGLRPKPLTLSTTDRAGLEQLVRCPSTSQQTAQRARIVLSANDGKNHAQIARELNLMVDTARLWRHRWLDTSRA